MSKTVIFLIPWIIAAGFVLGLGSRPQETTGSLSIAFRDLVSHYNPTLADHEDDALKVADLVPTASPEEISKTLPEIQSATAAQDETVKKFGAYILTIISYRSDSSHLLGEHVSQIAPLLSDKDAHMQQMGVLVLGGMKPNPPRTVEPPLLEFVHETDKDPTAQVNAISALLRLAPADISRDLKRFALRMSDPQTKQALANAIANSKTDDPGATGVLIAFLADDDEQVRFQTAQAFRRMPTKSIAMAKAALNQTIANPAESEEVKEAASQAVSILGN